MPIIKKALITGIEGQDGYYLSRFLLDKGYEVYGLVRRKTSRNNSVVGSDIHEGVKIFFGDLNNFESLFSAITYSLPDEVYNLAGVSDLKTAKENPKMTMRVNYEAVAEILRILKIVNIKARFCQASSSQIFVSNKDARIDERSDYGFDNSYGEAKLKTHKELVEVYRQQGMYVCSAHLFNHESPRRDMRFVTRKITKTLVEIRLGISEVLELGNLDAKRDWGFAGDYVEAMWLMLQQDKPEDFVIATGENHTVREFVDVAAKEVGINLLWEGSDKNALARDGSGLVRVKVNPEFYRDEKSAPMADITKARKILGWKPKTSFEDLVGMMIENDLKYVKFLKST